MSDPIRAYFDLRLADVRESLETNGFTVHMAGGKDEARELVVQSIIPRLAPGSISFGGTTTLAECGIYEAIKQLDSVEVLDTWDKSLNPEAKLKLRRRALTVDLFFSGTNALTEEGMLVNLDMIGNRVAALAFGPKNVVIVVGRNKIVPDLEAAFARIKDVAAPVNTQRLKMKTPCVKTGRCMDCKSSERICNVWTINEKSFPPGRIEVVLVNEDLGF
ncbi:MAG: lactate utilization protein [Proteobacteria bacterium]|nr:lactate utilization protein [Pseudomonadota bacterium]